MAKNFVNGLIIKRNEKAPDYVICGLSFKVEEFIKYINENAKNGWMNVDVKLSQAKKYYAELNTYEKGATPKVEEKVETIEYPAETAEEVINPEDIPF